MVYLVSLSCRFGSICLTWLEWTHWILQSLPRRVFILNVRRGAISLGQFFTFKEYENFPMRTLGHKEMPFSFATSTPRPRRRSLLAVSRSQLEFPLSFSRLFIVAAFEKWINQTTTVDENNAVTSILRPDSIKCPVCRQHHDFPPGPPLLSLSAPPALMIFETMRNE